MTTNATNYKLIHVGKIFGNDGLNHYLLLRKISPDTFTWFTEENVPTEVTGFTIEEALRLAARRWKENAFRSVICGFRYTLPERDEHGINALYHQMAASYASPNGTYYDEELGNNCFVQNASSEALDLWHRLR